MRLTKSTRTSLASIEFEVIVCLGLNMYCGAPLMFSQPPSSIDVPLQATMLPTLKRLATACSCIQQAIQETSGETTTPAQTTRLAMLDI